VITITRDELLDLLTTAALIGEDVPSLPGTRGELTAVIERRMRRTLDGLALTSQPPASIPTRIQGRLVTDAVRASSLDSDIVHVIAQGKSDRVVWDCRLDDSGEWQAQNGAYGRSRSWCLGILTERLGWDTEVDETTGNAIPSYMAAELAADAARR
jgi:hypothetical protein